MTRRAARPKSRTRKPAARVLLPEGPPGSWTITISNGCATVNDLIGKGRWKAYALKKRDKVNVYVACLEAGVTRATGKRRVGLVSVIGPRGRGVDPDGLHKSPLDALAYCGALTDDNRRAVELTPVEYTKGPQKALVISITDLGAAT